VKGRRTAYIGTFVVFLGACIGLALTRNYATLLVLRCLQSTGSASTIAIGSGVIGDISTRAERGGFMGFFQAGLLVPVAVGPVIGGLLAESFGWRSVFWFLTIYCGVFLVFLIVLLPETLRSIVANGSRLPSSLLLRWPLQLYQRSTKVAHDPNKADPASKKRIDLTGPIRILARKQAVFLLIFLAIHYAVWQMSITAMSTLFSTTYGLSERQIGLTFIANGAGSMIGTLLTGKILDLDYRRVQAGSKSGSSAQQASNSIENANDTETDSSFPLERARLRLLPIFSLLQSASILVFGWTIRYHIHISVPIITTFFTGWTAIAAQSAIMTYFVDVFAERAAAASASLNLARCLCAAGGTSIVGPMINGVGVGWASTICAAVQCVSLLGAGAQWRYGARWRTEGAVRDGT
jgi:MFS family permease